MTITQNKFDRTVADLRRIAKESGRVEFKDSRFWFFGSEAAILTLANTYKGTPEARQELSVDRKTYCFSFPVPGFSGSALSTVQRPNLSFGAMNLSEVNHVIDSGARFTVPAGQSTQKVHAFRAIDVLAATCDVVVGGLTSLRFETFPLSVLRLDGVAVSSPQNLVKYAKLFA